MSSARPEPNGAPRAALPTWQKLAAVLFVVLLVTVPLYCALRADDDEIRGLPPAPESVTPEGGVPSP